MCSLIKNLGLYIVYMQLYLIFMLKKAMRNHLRTSEVTFFKADRLHHSPCDGMNLLIDGMLVDECHSRGEECVHWTFQLTEYYKKIFDIYLYTYFVIFKVK